MDKAPTRIIDAHGHLGDILYPGGGELIPKRGIPFPASFWEWFLCERVMYRETLFFRAAEKISPYWSVRRERARNAAATLENLRKSLEGTGIVKCVCAPVAPNVRFDDILAAAEAEDRIIAFTAPDFTLGADEMRRVLVSDVERGAAGVKIHPIISGVEADSALVMSAVEAVRGRGVPVLLHSGPARYYLPAEKKPLNMDCAAIERMARLAAAFPDVNFIIGHAGLDDYRKVIALMPPHKNTYVDTSFQYPESMREIIAALGGERVMFDSDWHYGLRQPAIAAVMEACGDDAALRAQVFYENAARLFNIR